MTVKALVLFALVDVTVKVFGFSRVFQFVDRWGRRCIDPGVAGIEWRTVDRTVGAVRAATRYYYRQRRCCLPRAVTVYVLLRRRGVPATLRIGVKRFPFAAHAWVECLGEVVDDSRDDWRREPYVPILSAGD